jgi:hypothetical protein
MRSAGVVRDDINAARVARSWHGIPASQGELVASVVEPSIANDMIVEFYVH